MFLTAATTGMRRGEILALTWECLNFEEGSIEVRQAWKDRHELGAPKWNKQQLICSEMTYPIENPLLLASGVCRPWFLASLRLGRTYPNTNQSYRGNFGYRPIDIGIGIHTGTLIVGIIGDSERMQGTVVSDAVNLASRVQDVTKLYGANIIVSQDTFVRLDNPTDYIFRFLGKVRVKGKEHSVSLFAVFDGDKPERVALKNRTKQDFEEAILLFSKRQFPEASELFRKVVTRNPENRGAAIFLNRCSYFQNREKANWLLK